MHAPIEPTDLNISYVPNLEASYLELTQVGTWHMGQQVLGNGRKNLKCLSFDLHGHEQQGHATKLDTRSKGKSPCTLPHKAISLVNVENRNKLNDENKNLTVLDRPPI